MKYLVPWLAFGACVCLGVLCLAISSFQNKPTPLPQRPAVQMETRGADASPVVVPEPGPKAISFYHRTMSLIAVGILWNLLIPAGMLITGFSARLRSWAGRVDRRWYFSYAIYWTVFVLIYFILLLPLIFYGGFIHLHNYDLSNQTFARWLSGVAKSVAIIFFFGLAAGWVPFFIIKKSSRHWWLYLEPVMNFCGREIGA